MKQRLNRYAKKMHELCVNNRICNALYIYGRRWFPYFTLSFIALLIGLSFFKLTYDRPQVKVEKMSQDLDSLLSILHQIDDECSILSIKSSVNAIDFLNVKEFVGSEIGCLNLAYPRRWKGPYLHDNLTMQGHLYEIVKVKDGYYIVPGRGVELPNSLIIGKDIIFTEDLLLDEMLFNDGKLTFEGIPLARKFDFKIGDVSSESVIANYGEQESLEDVLKEFSEAMSYSQIEPTENRHVALGQ